MLSRAKKIKETSKNIIIAIQMPNSNTNNILSSRLITTSLLPANSNTKEGLLCYHKSLT